MDSLKRSSLLQLSLARFREFFREPEAVFWTFVFPILLATGLGIAFRSRPAEVVPVAVVMGSAGAEAAQSALSKEASFSVSLVEEAAALKALHTGKVALVVAPLPAGGAEYRLDAARPEARAARLMVDETLQRAAGRKAALETRDVLVSEPGSRYIDFVIPGLLGMGLMGSGIWGIGFPIVDARRKKLLKRLAVTPMSRSEYLMSFLVLRLAMMVVEVGILVAFGTLAFDVPFRGSLALFALINLLAAVMFGAIGLLVACRVQTLEGVSGLMNFVMLPMWIGSGVFFSVSNFPEAIQPLIRALPLTAAVDALRSHMLEGVGFGDLALEIGIMAAWGLSAFLVALKLFRWK